MTTQPREILDFWRAAGEQRWFTRDAAFDAECEARFLDAHYEDIGVRSSLEFEATTGSATA